MITKIKTDASFGDDGIIVENYDYYCTSEDAGENYENLPTEDVAPNNFCLIEDTLVLLYFDGEAWQVAGGASA